MSYAEYATGKDPVLDAALRVAPERVQLYFQDETGRPLPLYMRWRRPSQKPAFTGHQWERLKQLNLAGPDKGWLVRATELSMQRRTPVETAEPLTSR
jgi:hypothetical protein